MAALSLQAFSFGVVALVMVKVLAPAYFARQDTRTPFRIGVIAVATNVVLNLALFSWLRLHRQALFADRAHGADPGGPAPAGGTVPFALGDLAIDYDQRRVTVAGRRVELTATEYELLRVLAQDAGRVLTHETLLRRVWARRPAATPKIVRAYVKRLRDKLADEADRPALIVNERGVGYRMPRPGDR